LATNCCNEKRWLIDTDNVVDVLCMKYGADISE